MLILDPEHYMRVYDAKKFRIREGREGTVNEMDAFLRASLLTNFVPISASAPLETQTCR
mgnify:CR=1 FL=1